MKTVLARNLLYVFGLTCLSLALLYSTAWTQAIRDREKSSRILLVENVSVTDGSVSGAAVKPFSEHCARCAVVDPVYLALGQRNQAWLG